jgi:hypothetical protein
VHGNSVSVATRKTTISVVGRADAVCQEGEEEVGVEQDSTTQSQIHVISNIFYSRSPFVDIPRNEQSEFLLIERHRLEPKEETHDCDQSFAGYTVFKDTS